MFYHKFCDIGLFYRVAFFYSFTSKSLHQWVRASKSITDGTWTKMIGRPLVVNEKIRLMDQSNAIFLRIEGSLSVNVAVGEGKLGTLYGDMARRQLANNDLDLCVVTLELALTHFGEALRICRLNNHVEVANDVLRNIAHVKEDMRKVGIARAAA